MAPINWEAAATIKMVKRYLQNSFFPVKALEKNIGVKELSIEINSSIVLYNYELSFKTLIAAKVQFSNKVMNRIVFVIIEKSATIEKEFISLIDNFCSAILVLENLKNNTANKLFNHPK